MPSTDDDDDDPASDGREDGLSTHTSSCDLDIQPPTPSMDSMLDSFSFLTDVGHATYKKVSFAIIIIVSNYL